MNYNFFHGIRGLILLLHFLKIIDCNPKVFPFRGLNNGIDSVNSNYYGICLTIFFCILNDFI